MSIKRNTFRSVDNFVASSNLGAFFSHSTKRHTTYNYNQNRPWEDFTDARRQPKKIVRKNK